MSPASPVDAAAAWRDLALDLPRHHAALSAGESEVFRAALAGLPPLPAGMLAELDDAEAMRRGLDVLMVEAFVRRHRLARGGSSLDASAQSVAERLGLQPILSYPLYIRENPGDLDRIRRFTPYEAEFRFIRMHAAIEERFDELIDRLDAILGSPRPREAFREHFPALREGLASANRIMSGFRSPVRMPQADFYEGFRPYYDALYDPDSGELILDGPSGLQSYTYRIIAMQLGYQDELLDGWTRRIGRYHPPAVRERLDRVLAARDAGRSLDRLVCGPIVDAAQDLPHLHPSYGRHLPDLLRMARRGGFLAADVEPVLAEHELVLGDWPAAMPARAEVPELEPPAALSAEDWADLRRMAELEAGLMGMHLEHVATAAIQIGAARGTGGTSGVEFLLVATFRRAFPSLWQSGLGARIAAGE